MLVCFLHTGTGDASNRSSDLSDDFEQFWNTLDPGGVDGSGLYMLGLITPQCIEEYNEIYTNTSEYSKLGSAAATTIMALLPSLLTFGPLRNADISMLMHLDIGAALGASMLTFGLPVQALTTLSKRRIYRVKDLFRKDYEAVMGLVPSVISSAPVLETSSRSQAPS